jgi:hypothetical protein
MPTLTTLCSTEGTCRSEVTATARASSRFAASEVLTKPSNGILSFSKSESSKIAVELVRSLQPEVQFPEAKFG